MIFKTVIFILQKGFAMGNNIERSPSAQSVSSLYLQSSGTSSYDEVLAEKNQTKAISITWQRIIPQKTIEQITDFEQRKQAAYELSSIAALGIQTPLSKQVDHVQNLTCVQEQIFPSFLEREYPSNHPSSTLRPAAHSTISDPWGAKFMEGFNQSSLQLNSEEESFERSTIDQIEEPFSTESLVLSPVDPCYVVVPMPDEVIEKGLPESVLRILKMATSRSIPKSSKKEIDNQPIEEDPSVIKLRTSSKQTSQRISNYFATERLLKEQLETPKDNSMKGNRLAKLSKRRK